MSKKETEFDRQIGMKKREYDAAAEKRKSFEPDDSRKRLARLKSTTILESENKNWLKHYSGDYDYDSY